MLCRRESKCFSPMTFFWQVCKSNNPYATAFYVNMLCLISGIFVDPSYRLGLSTAQKDRGKTIFSEICHKLQVMNIHTSSEIVVEIQPNSQDLFTSCTPNTTDANFPGLGNLSEFDCSSNSLNSFELSLDEQQNQLLPTSGERPSEIAVAIDGIEKIPRKRLPVMDVINDYPLAIRDAARAVSALPATQVSVERLFSALRIITVDRPSLAPDTIDQSLFLRLNVYLH